MPPISGRKAIFAYSTTFLHDFGPSVVTPLCESERVTHFCTFTNPLISKKTTVTYF